MNKPAFLVKAGAFLVEKKPDICVGSGIVLMAAAGIFACVQTARKLGKICDDHEIAIEDAKNIEDEVEQKKAVSKAHRHMIFDIAGTYAIPLAMGIGGGFAIAYGFKQRTDQYIAAEAIAVATKKAYDAYRQRNIERNGEDSDYYCRYGTEREEIEVTDEKTGAKVKATKASEDQLKVASPWAFIIDEDCLLYKQCGGSPIHIRSELESFQSMYNSMYYNGTPIYYNDVVRWICGNGTEAAKRNLKDEGQTWGVYINDPEAQSDKGFNLNISTFFGKVGDDDPYDQDKLYIMVDFVPAGPIHLGSKKRVGGKYISQF